MELSTRFTEHAKVQYPIICGAMYPCSNPELVAAASEAGGLGIVQPISLVYVHRHEFRAGLRYIRSLTKKPIGLNVLVEKSSKTYFDRMRGWLNIALEEDVRFFITALGNPQWVIDLVKPKGGIVYHDVTERKWAERVIDKGIDGLICVNNRAGGHAGTLSEQALVDSLKDLALPLICAGGVGDGAGVKKALAMGYAGVQLGTRFIATDECKVHKDYKDAILRATSKDIVLTDKISGVPVSVIRTPYVEKVGTKAGPLARWLLRNSKTKHYMRLYYMIQSIIQLKKSSQQGTSYKDYFQAGKSVDGIDAVLPVARVFQKLLE